MPIPRALIFSVDRLLWLKDTIKDKIFPTDVKEPACNIYHLNWEDNDEDKFLIIQIDVVDEVNPNISWNVMKSEEMTLACVVLTVVTVLSNLLHTSATPSRGFIPGNKDIKLKQNSIFITVFWAGPD